MDQRQAESRAPAGQHVSEPKFGSGLWAAWAAIKRCGSVVMVSVAGALVGGVLLGAATIYCYCFGIYLGLPAGLLIGAILGWRSRPRDAALTFLVPTLVFIGADTISQIEGWNVDDAALLGACLSAVAVPIVFVSARRLPQQYRYYAAVACSWAVGVWTVVAWLRSIYSTD